MMDWVTVTSIIKWGLIAGFAAYYFYKRKQSKIKDEYLPKESTLKTTQIIKYED